jgi:hypothetical protein
MPAALTYPGVYIEEIPSGVRTIVGVATSITAFLGRAQRGPTDDPVTINSFGDFTRTFGDLNVDYPLGYAVRDFYLNGGQQAIIVRLQKNAAKSKNADLKIEAASSGKWGDQMTFTVDTKGITDDVAARYNTAKAELFNLTVYEDKENPTKGRVERLLNVSTASGAGAAGWIAFWRVSRIWCVCKKRMMARRTSPRRRRLRSRKKIRQTRKRTRQNTRSSAAVRTAAILRKIRTLSATQTTRRACTR